MASHIRISKAQGTWTVRAGGAVLGESSAALELVEGDNAPVIYFPRGDIAMAFLDQTDEVSHCPHKGDATHFSVVTKSRTITNAAWSYDTPKDAATQIAGFVAFYPMPEIAVEQI